MAAESTEDASATLQIEDHPIRLVLLFKLLVTDAKDLHQRALLSPYLAMQLIAVADKYVLPSCRFLLDGWMLSRLHIEPLKVLAIATVYRNGGNTLVQSAVAALWREEGTRRHPVRWDAKEAEALGFRWWHMLVSAADQLGYTDATVDPSAEEWAAIARFYVQ